MPKTEETLGANIRRVRKRRGLTLEQMADASGMSVSFLSQVERGLMVCGTGVGASIGANKMKGIRAAVCHDVHSAHQSVEHDDVNVMCIGAQIVGAWLAKDLISSFLAAEFSTEEEFRRRVRKLHEMDAEG